jgi:hypothetical protein
MPWNREHSKQVYSEVLNLTEIATFDLHSAVVGISNTLAAYPALPIQARRAQLALRRMF